MPLHDFATVHPTFIQTLQGSSGYSSLLDISFVSAGHTDGEGWLLLTYASIFQVTPGRWVMVIHNAVIQQFLLLVVIASVWKFGLLNFTAAEAYSSFSSCLPGSSAWRTLFLGHYPPSFLYKVREEAYGILADPKNPGFSVPCPKLAGQHPSHICVARYLGWSV